MINMSQSSCSSQFELKYSFGTFLMTLVCMRMPARSIRSYNVYITRTYIYSWTYDLGKFRRNEMTTMHNLELNFCSVDFLMHN